MNNLEIYQEGKIISEERLSSEKAIQKINVLRYLGASMTLFQDKVELVCRDSKYVIYLKTKALNEWINKHYRRVYLIKRA